MDGATANIAPSITASSSSSALLPPRKNDVFISFRGPDTRRKFLSHLRGAFSDAKIEFYMDEDIPKGKKVWEEIAEAIEGSYVAVVILSEHYASSTWCLRELKHILDCKINFNQVVIPVFYEVDPSHLRTKTRTYENAFENHRQQGIPAYTLQEWRECLSEIASLGGWHFNNERNEYELLKKIVQVVLYKLRQTESFKYFEGLVGIGESYGGIKSLLEDSSLEVRKIGIWGMPGIGKTTLANVAFLKNSSNFDGSCFLRNVREQSKKHGIDCLSDTLFKKLLADVYPDIGSAGTSFVMSAIDLRRLSRKRVFIVLDDVISSQQIEKLIGPPICLGAGSRVIVTSRDMDVFSSWTENIIGLTTLKSQQSLELFCAKAFKKVHPAKDYEKVAESVVSYANGNPLALKVLGSMLFRKPLSECNTVLKKLQMLPPEDIISVLKLSYDGLDEYQKNIFLDIACFWKGEHKQNLIKILDDLYGEELAKVEIKALQDKALVTISSSDNEVQMHDIIQVMGREIIRQENTENSGCRSRLWNANDVYDVLKNNKGTDAVKSIFFYVSQCRDIGLSPDVFKRMPNVKYLKFYISDGCNSSKVTLLADLDSLPNLRFLHWVGYTSKSLPSSFNPENLVELYMPNGHMEKLWDGVQNLDRLRSINLSSCKNLIELPNLSKASKLETLDLSYCSNLVEIPSWLEDLKELRELNLELCVMLTLLPRNIFLMHLKKVNCRGCSSLEKFSLTSSNMIYLSLENTAIKTLPIQIWNLQKVETLILSFCSRFENLPRLIGERMTSLQDLYLNETNVESLPESIKDLLHLNKLTLKRCNRLRSIPELPPFLSYFCATDCISLATVKSDRRPFNCTNFYLSTVARSNTGLKSDRRALYYHNCTNLNLTSRNNIVADAVDRIRIIVKVPWQGHPRPSFWNDRFSVCLPGEDIPDRFNIQKPESSLVFSIDSIGKSSRLLGFALCVVLGEFQEQCEDYEEINVQCILKLKNSGVQISSTKFEENYVECSQDMPRGLSSDHVFIWYDVNFFPASKWRESFDDLSFEFYGPHGNSDLVRKCGILPLYSLGSLKRHPKATDNMANTVKGASASRPSWPPGPFGHTDSI